MPTTKDALSVVTHQQYMDEMIARVRANEISQGSKFNARFKLVQQSEKEFAADFLTLAGKIAVRGQQRIVNLGFIGLDGKPLNEAYDYTMTEDGLIVAEHYKEEIGYLLGAGRAIDGFLNSILDTADTEMGSGELEETRQMQLV